MLPDRHLFHVTRLSFAPACVAAALLGLAVLGTPATNAAAADAQPNRIKVEYVPPTEPRLQGIYEFVKGRRALEKFQEIFSPFRISNDLTLLTKTCGINNAWYQRPALTICYEYLEDIEKN